MYKLLRRLCKSLLTGTSYIMRHAFIAIISGLRPLLGPPARCKFTITCTEFAILKLKEGPFFHALWAITRRLLACNPLYTPKN